MGNEEPILNELRPKSIAAAFEVSMARSGSDGTSGENNGGYSPRVGPRRIKSGGATTLDEFGGEQPHPSPRRVNSGDPNVALGGKVGGFGAAHRHRAPQRSVSEGASGSVYWETQPLDGSLDAGSASNMLTGAGSVNANIIISGLDRGGSNGEGTGSGRRLSAESVASSDGEYGFGGWSPFRFESSFPGTHVRLRVYPRAPARLLLTFDNVHPPNKQTNKQTNVCMALEYSSSRLDSKRL
jgi:hypothetical protein